MTHGKALMVLPLALSICFLDVGCAPQHSTESESPRPVKTMLVTAGNKPVTRSFPGKVEASKKVELAFQVPGLVVRLPVKEGKKVAKGEMIAQLRQDEFQARLKSAKGQLDQARATLRALQPGERPEEQLRREAQLRAAEAKVANAKTEFDRYARLVQTSAVSRSDYDLAETTYRVAQEDQKAALQIVEKGATARKEDIDAQEARFARSKASWLKRTSSSGTAHCGLRTTAWSRSGSSTRGRTSLRTSPW